MVIRAQNQRTRVQDWREGRVRQRIRVHENARRFVDEIGVPVYRLRNRIAPRALRFDDVAGVNYEVGNVAVVLPIVLDHGIDVDKSTVGSDAARAVLVGADLHCIALAAYAVNYDRDVRNGIWRGSAVGCRHDPRSFNPEISLVWANNLVASISLRRLDTA